MLKWTSKNWKMFAMTKTLILIQTTYAAMQVCLNNAVQYAHATELEVNVFENETSYTVMIYNNGRSPEKAIREGGGLTNLRYRIETAGGMMLVQSFPEFALVIEIPGLERREREE